MKITIVKYSYRDEFNSSCNALRAFRSWASAKKFVCAEAKRRVADYDAEAEAAHPENRSGPSEYACAKLGAIISTIEVEP